MNLLYQNYKNSVELDEKKVLNQSISIHEKFPLPMLRVLGYYKTYYYYPTKQGKLGLATEKKNHL